MRYTYDHDFHIHSKLSVCSNDPQQTTDKILRYAEKNNLKTICLTDHFWDDTIEGASIFYRGQNYDHITKAKPLPSSKDVTFLFGCETEFDRYFRVGISKGIIEKLDFVVIPITHFHMSNFTLSLEDLLNAETKAAAWIKRLDAVLDMNLPYHKIGLAHLTCTLISQSADEYLNVLQLLKEEDLTRLFCKAAKVGVGIELNMVDMMFPFGGQDIVLKPYRIAKQCGCKFYLGTDAHHPDRFDHAKEIFERTIDLLELTEEDKFIIHG